MLRSPRASAFLPVGMAAPKKKPPELDGEALARLVDELTARLRGDGAVARSAIAAPKVSLPAVLDRLVARGFEVRPKVVRVPLSTQLDALLARGPVPVQGLEKRLAGGATRAEARATLTRLIKEGRALVIRGGGKDGLATRAADDVLQATDRTRIAALARALAALAKAPGKTALVPHARWDDVRDLVSDVLGDLLGVAEHEPPTDAESSTDGPTSTDDAPPGRSSLLDALRAAADDSGISAIADAARRLDPPPSAPDLATALRTLAARGAIELRIASQPHLLAAEDRALCPTDPAGRVLAYARVLGG